MKRPSVTGFVVALALGTSAWVALAEQPLVQLRPSWWPPTTGSPVVDEWYSDLPWHQKLGTYAGNQIDEPLVMPFAALPATDQGFCAKQGWQNEGRCMIEVGVTNIIGMNRVDTLYDPTLAPIKDAPECKAFKCIEVMLKVSNFYGTTGDGGVKLLPRVYGNPEGNAGVYDKYTITDGTTYAPQMPWYMSHYCDALFGSGDLNDPVCYGDYFSTFNDGFNAWGVNGRFGWPTAVPWSVWPQTDTNKCAEGEYVCNFVMAGFDLKEVPPASAPGQDLPQDLQYLTYNRFLLQWFNNALMNFPGDQGEDENKRHFPWKQMTVTWDNFYLQSVRNPFLGTFANTRTVTQNPACEGTLTGSAPPGCGTTDMYRASKTLYPGQCSLADLGSGDATKLRRCGLNYELHHNGWSSQWPADFQDVLGAPANISPSNQYGRTSFLFAGVPGMQLPVTFAKPPNCPTCLSIYEQVYNTSLFSLYIPIANEADTKRAMPNRQYKDTEFYHTLLMSNHMEMDPDVFADGIRGKALWHNEYRMQGMYDKYLADARAGQPSKFPTQMFPAAFDASTAAFPFHNNTCDGCHVRNGSGIPINTGKTLDVRLQTFMTAQAYDAKAVNDYTFTGEIRPMKLVFFDLRRSTVRADGSNYSEPLAFTPLTLLQPPRTAQASDLYYSNAVMNYWGDSFHVTTAGNSYQWSYVPASSESLVVGTPRANPELSVPGKPYLYTPWQVKVESFQTSADCQIYTPTPVPPKPWPAKCDDVNGAAIGKAIETQAVGYMLLNGKRLGNSSAIEAMPGTAIKGFRNDQVSGTNGAGKLGEDMAGELIWTAGSRDGVLNPCNDANTHSDCFIGRFGWLGDRASLEDQVANAAFVEMNMTSSKSFERFYPSGKTTSPIRYGAPNCGPANGACVGKKVGNADLSEVDIKRMAEYARWVGNPTRSEFQVTLPEVVAGEQVFRNLKCNTCHVIDRINIAPGDTMLPVVYRERLAKRIAVDEKGTYTNVPFLSYLGTDLLMHDMGYLSQVGVVPPGVKFRDPATGVVLPEYRNYVQKIRTPALKGMRFNRFVTESYKNTNGKPGAPPCDFLLHDGRACDAVEAAFLHDGPAIKSLGTIDALNRLNASDMLNLRAFLYSL